MAVCEEEEFKRGVEMYVMGPDKVKHEVYPDFTGVTVTAGSLPNGTVNQAYPTTSFAATGGKGPYTWSVANGTLPPGLTVNATTGALSGTPTTTVGSPWAFTIAAADTLGQTDVETFTITVLGLAPTITTTTLPNVQEGSTYNQTLAATNGTPPLAWTIASGNLPPGLSLSAAGVISGTASLVAAETAFSFTVRVTDLDTRTATKALSITVTNAPAVTLTPATPPLGDVGVPYSFTLASTGGIAPVTYALQSGALPAGLTLSTGGVISGTPTAATSGTFVVRVTDKIGQTDDETYTVTVRPAPPVVTTTTLPAATVLLPYTATITWTGGAGPYTVTVTAGTLPSGIAVYNSGEISGIPAGPTGTYNFTVTVRDANGKNGSKALSIVVNPPALGITTTTLPGARVETPYSQTLEATGGTPPYVWSAAAGLPPGLTLSSAGVISGNPGTAGEYTFTVTVRDNTNATASKSLTITVDAAPLTSLAPAALPPAEVNAPYSYNFLAQGGTGEYTWAITSGDVPPGLTLAPTGTFAGTPTSNLLPQYVFVVTVSDGVSQVDKTVQIVVQNDSVPDADATLIWTPPSQYEDGSALPLSQIGGYRVYARPLGSTTWTYDIDIPSNQTNWYEFVDLPPGVWEFAVRAYDTSAQISDFSGIASKEILQ